MGEMGLGGVFLDLVKFDIVYVTSGKWVSEEDWERPCETPSS